MPPESQIWELNADGTTPHRLSLDWPEDADQEQGQWTPDGKHFVFMSRREGLNNIYEIVTPPWFEFWKRSTAVRLTAGQMSVLAATPSRDSTGLFMIGRIAQGAMHVYDAQQKRFVPFLDGLPAAAFVISPDRKWIVYADYPRHHLWRSKLDGSEKLRLTDIYAAMPQWSPDSKNIVFSDWNQLYLVSLDGGTPEKLVADPNNDVAPDWWPDGKSIAFNDFPRAGAGTPGNQSARSCHPKDIHHARFGGLLCALVVAGWKIHGRVAQNPSRMMLYTGQSGTWRDLKKFDLPWGFWVWSSDSKSIYMAVISERAWGVSSHDSRWEVGAGSAKFDGLEHYGSDDWRTFSASPPMAGPPS